jgi:putative phosphoesterase
LISDLHGNPLALDAVVQELERARVDRLVCLGDIAPGPQPRETVRRLQELECPVVLGNWDEWLVSTVPPLPGPDGPKLQDQARWWSAQLGAAERDYLESLAPRIELELDGARVLCVHGSPRSPTEDIYPITPDEELAAMLDDSSADVVAAGHTHVQLVRPHNSTLVVNPGSVGLPFHVWPPNGGVQMSPWAEYAIVTVDDGEIAVDLRRSAYDIDSLHELALANGMPHARWWVECWVCTNSSHL